MRRFFYVSLLIGALANPKKGKLMESSNLNNAYIKSSKLRPAPDLQTPVLNGGHDVLEQAPSIHALQHKSRFAWLFLSTFGRIGRLKYFLSWIAIDVVVYALNFVLIGHSIYIDVYAGFKKY
jgi:hypothetical protein